MAHRNWRGRELGFLVCGKTKLHASGKDVEGLSFTTKEQEDRWFACTGSDRETYAHPELHDLCPECGGQMGYYQKSINMSLGSLFQIGAR